ncbi:MerR family transcriptional regulator [Priestia megaterium]|uniref:MerR family transcriptional regulator n=1 Tax=Priestia megaterium TaxID=1404 RepID=UPI002E1DC32A|nr:MerR family transcriptional regulator [Priestia megaterium]MED4063167.1 MerR family transcriptional regulator [Priestia megaterium]
MNEYEVTYSTGDVAKDLGVSKTTIINLVKEFNLEVRKNPKNGYRFFTTDDLHKVREIQNSIEEFGKEKTLRDWNNPKIKNNMKSSNNANLEEIETLKEGLTLQEQYNQSLIAEMTDLKEQVKNIQLKQLQKEELENLIIRELPVALKGALGEKDNQIAELKEQLSRIEEVQNNRDKMLVEALRQSQESHQQLAAGLSEKRNAKKWWEFWKF